MNFNVELGDDILDLERDLEISISQIQKAISRVLKKTARWLEIHSKRELGVALGVPQHILSTRYRKTFHFKNGTRSVNVWFGLNPILAKDIGRSVQSNTGVKVGNKSFVKAFIATMDNGHLGVFKRKFRNGGRRKKRADGQWTELPIVEESFQLDDIAEPILERYQTRVEARFEKILKQELNFAMNIEAT